MTATRKLLTKALIGGSLAWIMSVAAPARAQEPPPEQPPPPPGQPTAPLAQPAPPPGQPAPELAQPAPPPGRRIFGIQVAAGLKQLPRDPVAGLMFGNNGGAPQTTERGLSMVLTFLPPHWPVSINQHLSYASSGKSGVNGTLEETVSTVELGVGGRTHFGGDRIRGFLGAGFALGTVKIEDQFADGIETWVGGGSGGFLEAGAFVRARSILDLGVTVRYSSFWSHWWPGQIASYWNAGGLFAALLVGFGP